MELCVLAPRTLRSDRDFVDEHPDGTEARRVRAWIERQDLWYEDVPDSELTHVLRLGRQISEQFTAMCIRVARRLHDEGVIIERIGKAVPILVHGLEYNEATAHHAHEANPPGVAQEFEDWILNPPWKQSRLKRH